MSAYLLDMLESATVSASLLLGLLGLGFAAFMPGMDRWNRRFFTCFFAVLALDIATAFAELVAYNDPALIKVGQVAGYVDSLLPSILVTMPTLYLLHCCGEDWWRSALFRGAFTLWAAFLISVALMLAGLRPNVAAGTRVPNRFEHARLDHLRKVGARGSLRGPG